MDDIDKMVVEDGVIKVKEPEKIIPATETVIDTRAIILRKVALESHIKELQQSVDNDTAQINSMQAEVDKINVMLGGIPSEENVPIDGKEDGADGVG